MVGLSIEEILRIYQARETEGRSKKGHREATRRGVSKGKSNVLWGWSKEPELMCGDQ